MSKKMGRPIKLGLDFFPEVVHPDEDFQFIDNKYPEGYKVVRKLWCRIYKYGYFCDWNERVLYNFAGEIKIPAEKVQEILDDCFKIELFSREMFETYSILTSSGVQWRWKLITHAAKRTVQEIDPKYNLLKKKGKKIGRKSEESPLNSEESPLSSGEKSISQIDIPEKSDELTLSSGEKSINSGITQVKTTQSKTANTGITLTSNTSGKKIVDKVREGEGNAQRPPAQPVSPGAAAPETPWDACVRCWFDFFASKFNGAKPTFEKNDVNTQKLKMITTRLRERAEASKVSWTPAIAYKRLWNYLEVAYRDPFLKSAFLLKNIEQKHDAIVNNMLELSKTQEDKPLISEETIQYLYERYKENTLEWKFIEPTHYDYVAKEKKIDLITPAVIAEAKARRMKSLEGSERGEVQKIWKAYLEGTENAIVVKDRPELMKIAKKLGMLSYFHSKASSGAENAL